MTYQNAQIDEERKTGEQARPQGVFDRLATIVLGINEPKTNSLATTALGIVVLALLSVVCAATILASLWLPDPFNILGCMGWSILVRDGVCW